MSNKVKYIYRKKTINRIIKKAKYLELNQNINPYKFMSYRILFTVLVFIILLIYNDKGYIYAPISAILIYLSFEYYLDYKISKRKEKLNYEAIFFFQVLVLTLESSRNLQSGIETTCNSIDSEISKEFKKTIEEIKFGKTLTESLTDMKERIPSEEINTVLLNITQSTIFGNNIIESLNNQIDYLRDKKLLHIKSKINKMPVKVSVVSVVFIIPIVLLLILGPILVNFLLNK